MHKSTFAILSAAAALALSCQAQALVLDSAGNVTDWGVKPFSTVFNPVGVTSTLSNNISPINYPYGVGYRPSGGEAFDLEEMYIRSTGGHTLQVLLVTSGPLVNFDLGNNYYLGDLLLDTNGDHQFDYGFTTQAPQALVDQGRHSAATTAATLYGGITTAGVQPIAYTYAGYNDVEPQINSAPGQLAASFVQSGTALGTGTLLTTTFNYGSITQNGQTQDENNTHLYEFTFLLPDDITHLDAQIDWGCGNDVIRGSYDFPTTPTDNSISSVPEPATAALGLSSLTALALAGLRRRPRPQPQR